MGAKQEKMRGVVTPRDTELLWRAYQWQYAPFSALARLGFAVNSKHSYHRINTVLAGDGYLHRFPKHHFACTQESVYQVAALARPLIVPRLVSPFHTWRSFRPDRPPSNLFLFHHLQVVQIASHLIAQAPATWQVDVWTEPHCRDRLFYPDKRPSVRFWPDGLLIQKDKQTGRRSWWFIEYENSTSHRDYWDGKVGHYLDYWEFGGCYYRYGAERFGVLVIGHSQRHLNVLRSLTSELTTDPIFYFAHQDDVAQQAYHPIWQRNDGMNDRWSLLDMVEVLK